MEPLPEAIGPYKVAREVGRGGMGIVYLGHDERLDRPVAIKALAEDLADDPERLARFEREARVLASLSHGNIATVYGFEGDDDRRYLVMEFVDGQPLSDRLADGPLSMNEALSIAAQIAAGVEAAHEAGVVHRDLKPGNVIIRPDGTPKVLDFGLARELPARSSHSQFAEAPTVQPQSFTKEGLSIGTPGYMSPEQVRGMAVDKRTDIFAFGCVLYECLCGTLAFPGETGQDSIAAILEREPDWSQLPAHTPPTVQLLLRRCLQKDRRRRLRDIGDARIELEQAIDDPTSTSLGLANAALAKTTTGRRSKMPWAIVAVLTLISAVAVLAALRPATPAPRLVTRLTVSLPEDATIRPAWMGSALALSDDGRQLVYVGPGEPWSRLYLRRLDQLRPAPIAGTDGANSPFFSPDGEWIAFGSGEGLKKVSVDGGPPSVLCDSRMTGGDWGPDGTIVFATWRAGLRCITAAGGESTPLTELEEESDVRHTEPVILPDGRNVLFTQYDSDDGPGSIMTVSLTGGEPRLVVENGKSPRYSPTGHIVFYREDTVMTAPFDLETLEPTSPPVPIVENVGDVQRLSSAQFYFADDGTLVYVETGDRMTRSMVWVDTSGNSIPISNRDLQYGAFSLSPDEKQLVVVANADETDPVVRQGDLWMVDLERDMPQRITRGEKDSEPAWSPDGRWIAFASKRDGDVENLYIMPADLSAEPWRLTTSEHDQGNLAWTPDSRMIAYDENEDIMALALDTDGQPAGDPVPLIATPDRENAAAFSPDGVWLGYSSNASGGADIYVSRADGSGVPVRLSDDRGFKPIWARHDDVIYYWSVDRVHEVPFTVTDDRFVPGLPEIAFEFGRSEPVFLGYVNADGTRFAGMTLGGFGVGHGEITLVQNWFDELRAATE